MAKAAIKTLLLLRHAKAVPAEAGGEDRERPLTARGIDDANAMGRHIARKRYAPDVILCSPSKRTKETFEHVKAHLPPMPQIIIDETLYLATQTQLLRRIQKEGTTKQTLFMIGHNPGMAELALALAAPEGKDVRRMAEKFPTCALAVLEFKIASWRDAAPGEGLLREFKGPKDPGA